VYKHVTCPSTSLSPTRCPLQNPSVSVPRAAPTRGSGIVADRNCTYLACYLGMYSATGLARDWIICISTPGTIHHCARMNYKGPSGSCHRLSSMIGEVTWSVCCDSPCRPTHHGRGENPSPPGHLLVVGKSSPCSGRVLSTSRYHVGVPIPCISRCPGYNYILYRTLLESIGTTGSNHWASAWFFDPYTSVAEPRASRWT
jgi:hypothetical protein